jgi:hypothetical protein
MRRFKCDYKSWNVCCHLDQNPCLPACNLETQRLKYKAVNLAIILYGYGLSHEGVFENRVLRKIFGPKREGVTGGWSNFHNGFMICIPC